MRGRGGWGMGYAERNFADQNFREKYLKENRNEKTKLSPFYKCFPIIISSLGLNAQVSCTDESGPR